MATVNSIFEVTTKPMIFDADTGGRQEHFAFAVKSLERLGVSAVIIEDKIGLKKNSLFGTEVDQTQDSIDNFCNKIRYGKKAQLTEDFMIIARIESLILEKGMSDALKRASAYTEAGADAIMIHSKKKEPEEVLEFCDKYNQLSNLIPLVVVPTSYNKVYERDLADAGVKIIIYANHMLRAAYPAMMKVAKSILRHGRSAECEKECMSIKQIINLIPWA
jgi:phosphoenolpyruvate phosphomutase